MTRRIGRFSVDADLARQFSTELKRVMGACIIVRAEAVFDADRIEYVAVSEHFREISEGEIAPTYRWVFTSDGEFWCEEVGFAQ